MFQCAKFVIFYKSNRAFMHSLASQINVKIDKIERNKKAVDTNSQDSTAYFRNFKLHDITNKR